MLQRLRPLTLVSSSNNPIDIYSSAMQCLFIIISKKTCVLLSLPLPVTVYSQVTKHP